jgi:hypothetical protein
MAKGDPKKVQIRNVGREGDPHYVINFRGRDVTQFCREWELITGFVVPAQHVVDAVINVAAQSEWRALSAKREERSLPMPNPLQLRIRDHLAGGTIPFEQSFAHRDRDPNEGRMREYRDQHLFHDYAQQYRARLEERLLLEAQTRFRYPQDQLEWIERERRNHRP